MRNRHYAIPVTLDRRSFSKDCGGTSTIEFALILPVLVLLLIGAVAGYDYFRASKMITRAATTTVDLTTRVDDIDDTKKADLFKAASAVTGPYSSQYTDFAVVVTSVINNGNLKNPDLAVDWSLPNDKGTALTNSDLSSLNLPDLDKSETVVVAIVSGKYDSFISASNFSSVTFTDTQIRRPRKVEKITNSTTN